MFRIVFLSAAPIPESSWTAETLATFSVDLPFKESCVLLGTRVWQGSSYNLKHIQYI